MNCLGRYASGLLIVLTGAFLAGALAVAFRIIISGLPWSEMPIAALCATVAGVFLTAQRQIADRQESTSKFYLEKYQEGFNTAYEMLESVEPGDPLLRMKWIAAARVLATARGLYDRITVDAHRTVANMGIPHQAQRFRPFFEEPSWYYYGVKVLPVSPAQEAQQLDEAAKQSTAGEGSLIHTHREIPEKVLHTLWQAIAYPKNYKDVLGERFSEGDRLFLPFGLRNYLLHREQWASASGALHKRQPGEPHPD
jgi:hypothetical protein